MFSELLREVKEVLGGMLLEARQPRRQRLNLQVKPEVVVDAARLLRDKLGFDHIAAVTGVDRPDGKFIEVIYHVWSTQRKVMAALKVQLPRDNPSMPSLIGVWEGALYHERETWEMLGVRFEGHPNLSLLLLPEDWEGGYPLRKDYVLKVEA